MFPLPGVAFPSVERLVDRIVGWLVTGLLALAVAWGTLLVLLAFHGPWGWKKLISVCPLAVAVWTSRSVLHREGARKSAFKLLIGSLGVFFIAISFDYGWYTGRYLHLGGNWLATASFTNLLVPVVFFTPAVLMQTWLRTRGEEHAGLNGV